jgi:hypothetical protein
MHRLTTSLLLLVLAGCAATGPYGNHAGAPPAYDQRMAEDTVRQFSALHPPATTHVRLDQPATDPYGAALVEALRKTGYAVTVRPESARASSRSPAKDAQAGEGTDTHYVVDKLGDGRYLVSLRFGGEMLSRAYRTGGGHLAPAGYWVRRE